MEVRVISTLEEYDDAASELDALRRAVGPLTVNNDPGRYRVSLVHASPHARPYVALFADSSGVRGGIIARLSCKSKSVRVGYASLKTPALRTLDVVYGGVLADQDDADGALTAICGHLQRLVSRRVVDRVFLNSAPEHVSHRLNHLRIRRLSMGSPARHWKLRLTPYSRDKTLSKFSKKHRYNMRRADRILSEATNHSLEVDVATSPQDLDWFIPAASSIVSGTYQDALGVGFKDSSYWRETLSYEASVGRLRCYLLRSQDNMIAFQVGSIHRGVYYLEATSFTPSYARFSPGQVLLCRVIEDLCSCGGESIDYGYGDAQYKQMYGSDSWTETSINMYGSSMRALAVWALDSTSARISAIGRSVFVRQDGGSQLKRWWRGQLSHGAARSRGKTRGRSQKKQA